MSHFHFRSLPTSIFTLLAIVYLLTWPPLNLLKKIACNCKQVVIAGAKRSHECCVYQYCPTMRTYKTNRTELTPVLSHALSVSCGIYFRNYKNILAFSIFSPWWDRTGHWNLSLWKPRTSLLCIVDTMVTDGLVTQGARASAIKVSILFVRNILIQ